MIRSVKRLLAAVLLLALLLPCTALAAIDEPGEPTYSKTLDNGNQIIIEDKWEQFSEEDIPRIAAQMERVGQWGNVVLVTAYQSGSRQSLWNAASRYYSAALGPTDGVLFMIDQNDLFIFTRGNLHQLLSDRHCLTIADNVYSLAAHDQYGECALKCFDQIGTVLEGGFVAEPMRIICSLLIAAVLAMAICMIYVRIVCASNRPDIAQLAAGMDVDLAFSNIESKEIGRRVSISAIVLDAASEAISSSGSSSGSSSSSSSGSSGSSGGGGHSHH